MIFCGVLWAIISSPFQRNREKPFCNRCDSVVRYGSGCNCPPSALRTVQWVNGAVTWRRVKQPARPDPADLARREREAAEVAEEKGWKLAAKIHRDNSSQLEAQSRRESREGI